MCLDPVRGTAKQVGVKHPLVLGLQYGDEGKGKITDVLARQAAWIIRFNGGNNAGHTLWLNGKKLVTHSVPSGVRSPQTKNFIGTGCVIDAVALEKELAEISEAGVALGPDRLKVDHRAHLTLPIHLSLDVAREGGPQGVGSTKKGIGPSYTTKMDRVGLRVADAVSGEFREKIEVLCRLYNPFLVAQGLPPSSVETNLAAMERARALLSRYVSFERNPFFEISKSEKCVLEGAQGVSLDLDHGTYPFVTSSNTLPAYASVGGPFPMRRLGAVIGVAKAYLTRVGLGPMATELNNETGHRIRERGQEYGATTGRPRRIGWLNIDELAESVRISDCSHIVLTKGDILDGEPTVAAWLNGKLVEFAGWPKMLSDKDPTKLDPNLQKFIQAIEGACGVPVAAVGTGADRAAIWFKDPNWDFWADVS